jgi:hypothetical protein
MVSEQIEGRSIHNPAVLRVMHATPRHLFAHRTFGTVVEKGTLKATTVHHELRVLRRMLNVTVHKKLLFANPRAGVEFPARVDGLFRPHYMTWSEQQKIEIAAPNIFVM